MCFTFNTLLLLYISFLWSHIISLCDPQDTQALHIIFALIDLLIGLVILFNLSEWTKIPMIFVELFILFFLNNSIVSVYLLSVSFSEYVLLAFLFPYIDV